MCLLQGVPVKSTLSRSLTTQYAFLVTRFLAQVIQYSQKTTFGQGLAYIKIQNQRIFSLINSMQKVK